MSWHYYEDRTLCSVLDEMRSCYKSRNFSHLLGLIEEAQTMANRMEAGLAQKSSLQEWDLAWREKRKELKNLDRQIKKKKLKTELGQNLIKAAEEIEQNEGS